MNTAKFCTAVEALVAADPDCLDGEELESVVRASSEVSGWLDAYEMRCARRSRQLADAGYAPPPESLLAPVLTPIAWRRSRPVRSTTSGGGANTAARPTSTT